MGGSARFGLRYQSTVVVPGAKTETFSQYTPGTLMPASHFRRDNTQLQEDLQPGWWRIWISCHVQLLKEMGLLNKGLKLVGGCPGKRRGQAMCLRGAQPYFLLSMDTNRVSESTVNWRRVLLSGKVLLLGRLQGVWMEWGVAGDTKALSRAATECLPESLTALMNQSFGPLFKD